MRKILTLVTVFVMSLCLCSFKSSEEIRTVDICQTSSNELVDTVYLDNYFGADYRHDIYKTDRTVKEMNVREIAGWTKKKYFINKTFSSSKGISGKISSKYLIEDYFSFNLKKIFGVNDVIKFETEYNFTSEQMNAVKWEITPDVPGTYISIGLNVQYRVYEINNYKQKFVWFGQGDYVFESMMEVLVPEVEYISLNYMNETTTTIYEY